MKISDVRMASYFSRKKIANPKSQLSSTGCLFHMCEIPAKFENKETSPYLG